MPATGMNTIISKLKESGLPYYLAKYIDWYMTDPKERIPWDELCKVDDGFVSKTGANKTQEFAKENWLTRADVQEGIKIWLSHMKTVNMLKIYNTMFEKATNGDVQAAKWVEDFHNSKFFQEEHDEINDFLNNVNFKKPKTKRGS